MPNWVDNPPLDIHELFDNALKKDDTEIQLQLLFTFLRVLSYQDTREELLWDAHGDSKGVGSQGQPSGCPKGENGDL